MPRGQDVDIERLKSISSTHTVTQAAKELGIGISTVYAYERLHGFKCVRTRSFDGRSEFEVVPGDPTNIPEELRDHVSRMYTVGHPPGAIAALRGLRRRDVCALLGIKP